jgi:hypothetical protein
VLREHQLETLILSLHDSFSSSKGKLAPPASFTRPHARRPPFSMGMIACPSLVARLLAQREGDVALAPAALIAAMAARAAISSVDVRRKRPPLLDGANKKFCASSVATETATVMATTAQTQATVMATTGQPRQGRHSERGMARGWRPRVHEGLEPLQVDLRPLTRRQALHQGLPKMKPWPYHTAG